MSFWRVSQNIAKLKLLYLTWLTISTILSKNYLFKTYNTHNRKDFTDKNCFSLDTIKIRNPEKWKVAKLSDFLLEEYDIKSNTQTTKVKSFK